MVNLQRSSKVALALIMMFLLLLIPILHNIASAHATLENYTTTKWGYIEST